MPIMVIDKYNNNRENKSINLCFNIQNKMLHIMLGYFYQTL